MKEGLSIDFGDSILSGFFIIPLFLLALPILIIAAILDKKKDDKRLNDQDKDAVSVESRRSDVWSCRRF